jgi:hypothetical protein
MKNLFILIMLFTFCIANTQAQDTEPEPEPLKGNKGQLILPESGDIGLGVNMIPFFNWFGNAFNNNANNQFASNNKFFTIFGNSVLMGKYMLSEKTAVRVNFGFNVISTTLKQYVQEDASNDPLDMVQDSWKNDVGNYTLALGYEMRRGKRRIQGYYGADIIFNYINNSSAYTYGNGYSSTNVIPTSFNFGTNINNNMRVLNNTGNSTFGIGLRGFVGVEYFVAPKLSLGAEFGWGFTINSTFDSVTSSEFFEASTSETMIQNTTVAGNTVVAAGVDNLNGAVFMLFYF